MVIKRTIRRFQKKIRMNQIDTANTIIQNEIMNCREFFVKLSNCKVVSYETNIVEKYNNQIALDMCFISSSVINTQHKIYWLDKTKFIALASYYISERTFNHKLMLLLILASSTRCTSLQNFLNDQKTYFI